MINVQVINGFFFITVITAVAFNSFTCDMTL